MDLPKKDIDFMTHRKERCSIAEMSSSTSRNMDLTIHPNLRRREWQVYLEYSDESTETFESPAHSDEPSETADSPAPPPRRSERERRQPNYYGFQCNLSDVKEPKSVCDVQKSQEWADAMRAETDSLHDHNVWELVELPEGRKPVGSKWVFKLKMNADGSVERCKARLVAQGYSQKEGLD